MTLQADKALGKQQIAGRGDESQVRHSGQAPVDSHSTARQVTMAGLSSSDVANRLAAAKPVSWQGKGDIFQAPWVPILRGKWLVLDLWAGVSGLCLALLSMGCTFWALAAEMDPQAAAIAQANFPNLVHVGRVEDIDETMLAPFFAKRKIRGVILGGGSPCQGNTVLNKDRRGLLDARSWQPTEIARLKRLVQQIDPQIEVVTLLENVASMPDPVLSQYNQWMGFPPVKVSAGQCGWVQRNRFVWLGGAQGGVHTDLRPPTDWEWKATEGSGIPTLTYVGKKPIPSKVSFLQGFQPLFDPSQVVMQRGKGSIHPFTREFFHPEDRVSEVSPAAAQRFYEDHRRFPPASYEEQSLLWKGTEWRQLEPEERTQMMGWPIHFTAPRHSDSQRSPSVQNSVIGNGFHIPTILAVLCCIPQLLATKLPPPLQCMDEVALVQRLEGTVWEPHRLKSFPGLLTPREVTVGMKSCFPDLSIPHHVWDRVEERLQWCDLSSLQAFSAWQRMRGQEWKILGPIPTDAVARTQIYAGLSDQRYPGTSSRGLDHLLPPGLGPEAHILEGSLLRSPFSPTPWPEPDIAFVIQAICVWQHHLQSLSNILRGVMRSVIKAVQPLQTALAPFRCFAAQQVSASKNAALMAALTVLLRWPDVLQPQCLILGYPIVGAIPSSGVFRALPPGEDPDFTQWLGPAAVAAVDEICASRPPRFAEEILEATLAEQEKGFCGPFRSRAFMDAKYGPGQWRPLQRFLHVQPCGKHRVIDNAKKTLHNHNTSMMETITTVNVDFIATVLQQLLQGLGVQDSNDLQHLQWFDARLGTDDLPDAYRALPVLTDHQSLSIIAIWQPSVGWSFMELYGLAYGLGSAVVAFNRFPQLGVAACRRCLYGLAAAYFDDELSIECVRDADISQRSLQFLFTALGAAPQPAKSFPAMANRHYLGTSVHLGSVASDGTLRFQPKASTSHKVFTTISKAIDCRRLEPDVAGKLRGDLNWMFSNCAGRIGKVAGPLLRKCQHDECQELNDADLETLAILRAIVVSAQPRDISVLHQPRPLVRVYSDASFEDNVLRLGWVLFPPHGTPLGGTCVVPQEEIDRWILRKQQIFVGESICGLVVPLHLSDSFRGCDVIWWVDNEAAVASLVRGSSSQDDVHEVVQATNLVLHELSSRVWWEWIDSSSNPSDGLSRSGLDDIWSQTQPWKLCEIPFPVMASRANFLAKLRQEYL